MTSTADNHEFRNQDETCKGLKTHHTFARRSTRSGGLTVDEEEGSKLTNIIFMSRLKEIKGTDLSL